FAGVHKSNTSVLRRFDSTTGKTTAEIDVPYHRIDAIALRASGDELISADRTGTVSLWRLVSQRWQVVRDLKLGDKSRWVFLSRNGELAAAVRDNSVDVWDVDKSTKVRSIPTEPDWSIKNGAFDMSNHRIIVGYLNDRSAQVGWAMWDFGTG